MGRWDFLYEIERQPIGDWLLDRLAEELEKEIRAFPPAVDGWENEAARRRFEPLLASGRRPSDEAVRLALRLARLDVAREYEAVDEIVRSGGVEATLRDPEDRELCQFLWRYLEDKLLDFAEATRSRFKRPELAGALDKLERRLFRVTAS